MSKFIGQRLKQLRENAKLSVAELSTLIGKNRATVYRYENGEIEMPLELIIPLAKAFGVTPADVLGICEEDVLILTNDEKNLVKAYRNRPDMQRAVNTLLSIDNKPQIQMQPKFESADPLTKFQKTGRYGEKIEHLPKSIMDKVHSLDDDEPPDIG